MYDQTFDRLAQGVEQGLLSAQEVEQLSKALSAGYGGAGKPTDLTYGGVIQAESLEATLKSVTFDMANLKFWPAIQIDKASNLFEQYNRITAYGDDAAPYMAEGGAPSSEDSTYVRDGQKIVFFGRRRKVTHQMTLVNTVGVGDVVAQQAKEGTMSLLKTIEREMYWGNAHFINAAGEQTGSVADIPADSIGMNGLLEQLLKGDKDEQQRSGDFEGYGSFDSIVKDLAGTTMTQDNFEEMAVTILENFGEPSQVHMEPAAVSSFVRQFYPQFRSQPGLSNQTVGYDVNSVQTTAGKLDLKPNVFLRPRSKARAKAIAGAPLAPASVTGAAQGSGGVILEGDYIYTVTAVNDYGESSPVSSAPIACAEGDSVILNIAAVSGAKYYKVYRTAPGGAAHSAKFIFNVKAGAQSAALDLGKAKPGFGEAFLLDMRSECMKFKQLAPLSKINFAVVSTALEFGIILYGALFVYTPRFNGVFQNVGK